MAAVTLNISLSKEQAALINQEVDSGRYASASEVVREALRHWLRRRIEAGVAKLEKAHAGAWERDTTPEEQAAILRIQKEVRAELTAQGASHDGSNGREPKKVQETAVKPAKGGERPLAKLAALALQFPANPDSPGDLAAQHDHYLYGTPKKA